MKQVRVIVRKTKEYQSIKVVAEKVYKWEQDERDLFDKSLRYLFLDLTEPTIESQYESYYWIIPSDKNTEELINKIKESLSPYFVISEIIYQQ